MPVIVTGPFFSADRSAVSHYIRDAEGAVANAAYRKVRAFQSLFFRYDSSVPTGRAGGAVKTLAQGDHHVVTQGDIVYGAWLEGVGSRNATTRFKGYAIFRRTTASIDRQAVTIAQPFIDRMCRELS